MRPLPHQHADGRFSLPGAVARFGTTEAIVRERGALTRLTRGVWANTSHPDFHPLVCVPKLLGREQGYVSFLTALHLRGVISQIPRTIQVATTGTAES